jgi:hypothetical protein
MSSLGRLGRFGNQIFQYAFLRICANESGARVGNEASCPRSVGALFGSKPRLSAELIGRAGLCRHVLLVGILRSKS